MEPVLMRLVWARVERVTGNAEAGMLFLGPEARRQSVCWRQRSVEKPLHAVQKGSGPSL